VDLLETNYAKVATKSEIPVGKMKHIEVNGKEIMIANVEGKFYAISDRCGHENARLSTGTLTGTIVICPFHYSRFDVTTGKLISGPILEGSEVAKILAKVPAEVQKGLTPILKHTDENQSLIKTYDLPVYKVKVDGSDLLVQL
jgi:nitrite reductase/ring-hydroxylating ferredoxin subunit